MAAVSGVRTATTDQSAGQPAYATVSSNRELDEGAGMVRQMTRTPYRAKNRKGTIGARTIERLALETRDVANPVGILEWEIAK